MKKKKTICLVTNWYPTPENPYQGHFFREQAIELQDKFDFVVVHYKFVHNRWHGYYKAELCKEEYNIREYQIYVQVKTINDEIRSVIRRECVDESSREMQGLIDAMRDCIDESIDAFYTVSGQSEGKFVQSLAQEFNKPYVVSEHGPVPWLDTVVSQDNKTAIERADLFLAISNDKIRQVMMQGIKMPPCVYVGNMVDESVFVYKESNNEVKTFVTVGAHVFYKNYDMLIAVFNKLKEISPIPFRLIIVGYDANRGYSRDAQILEKKIHDSEFSDFVEMFPSVEHCKIAEIYTRADAFVMTSVQEGQPVSAIEAACCGLPIFSTRCGGVEDYVDDSIGRIFGINDVESMARGLSQFLDGIIEFNSEHIRNVIINKFGRKQFKLTMENAFESVIDKRQ